MAINMLVLTLAFVCILFFICYWIYGSRGNRSMLIKKVTLSVIAVLVIFLGNLLLHPQSGISNLKDSTKPYVIERNETKSMDGTHIKLNQVFLDLLNLQAAYSVRGKSKVVAIELKRKPEDVEALGEITGLWTGGRILSEYSIFGINYKRNADEFVDPVFVVFYLSDGGSIYFEVKDEMKVKSKVGVVSIDKEIRFDDSIFKLSKAYFGLNYSSISFDSNFMPTNIAVTIIDGDTTVTRNPGWSGGGNKYCGDIWFDPVKSDKLQIIVKDEISNKENILGINVDLHLSVIQKGEYSTAYRN